MLLHSEGVEYASNEQSQRQFTPPTSANPSCGPSILVTFDRMHFERSNILAQERNFRTNFVNALSGFKSANLIGTTDEQGRTNLAIFSSVVHLGSNPPLLGFVTRPVGEQSHTYKNILATGVYTINHVPYSFVRQAHRTSARFDRDVSEFTACGLTIQREVGLSAPFVAESPVRIAMRFMQDISIELNQTHLICGQVEHVFLAENLVDSDGRILLEHAEVACISGLDTYHSTKHLLQLPYAKVDQRSIE